MIGSLALWRHLALQRRPARMYILGGVIMWGVILVLRIAAGCYRNLTRGRQHWFPQSSIQCNDFDRNDDQIALMDACHVEVTGVRAWQVKPGQYIYLWMPVSFTTMFQTHPFWVIWWDYGATGQLRLHLLVRARGGFTSRLLSHREQCFSSLIAGPFGKSIDVGHFGTVLMFATDIGIASHLPYLKSLMQGREDSSICTSRVLVTWQVQKTGKPSSMFEVRQN